MSDGGMSVSVRERLREMPLARWLDIDLVAAEPGRCLCRMPVDERHRNVNGVAVGAGLFALADLAMGLATTSACGPGESCASIDMHVSFLESHASGPVICEATLLKKGRRFAFAESSVRTEAGRTIARLSATLALFSEGQSRAQKEAGG